MSACVHPVDTVDMRKSRSLPVSQKANHGGLGRQEMTAKTNLGQRRKKGCRAAPSAKPRCREGTRWVRDSDSIRPGLEQRQFDSQLAAGFFCFPEGRAAVHAAAQNVLPFCI